jgi:hypothetical protein
MNRKENSFLKCLKRRVKKENGMSFNEDNKEKFDELTPNVAIAKALCANEYSKKVQRRTENYKVCL